MMLRRIYPGQTLRSITDIECECLRVGCTWRGKTGDCRGNDEGDLSCPKCGFALVEVHYNEHEKQP